LAKDQLIVGLNRVDNCVRIEVDTSSLSSSSESDSESDDSYSTISVDLELDDPMFVLLSNDEVFHLTPRPQIHK